MVSHLTASAHNPATSRTQVVLVLMAACGSLAMQLRYIPVVGMGRGFEAVSIANSLATHGTFADPFDGPSGPTAHLAPAYPLLLAAIQRLSPDAGTFRSAALGLTALLHVLQVLLLFVLAGELFPDRRTPLVTAALVLAVPLYQVIPPWETMWISCGVLAFWLLARRRRVVAGGILGGVLLLFNPSPLAILLPIAVAEWRQVRPVAVFLLLAGLVVVPWQVRNYLTFHELFFVRDNLGLELDVYNNDCEAFGASACVPHPVYSADERQAVGRMGETHYNRLRFRRAMAWFASHPGEALALTGKRMASFWFPVEAVRPFGSCIAALTAAAGWGFWRLWRDRHPAAAPMLAIAAVYPPVYYLVRFDLRYRYPILWLSILLAAYGISHWRGTAVPRTPARRSPMAAIG
jgi:hypothetical protein